MNPPYTHTLDEGVRNLLLGRILLKANVSAGATEIRVGDVFSSPYAFLSIPGSNLFWNYTDEATIVQPSAANTPTGVEHSEAITLSLTNPNALHLTSSTALTKSYTTARGAYIRPTTLPDVCAKLKFIDDDFLVEGAPPPQDRWFPGALVETSRASAKAHATQMREYLDVVIVRYACLMDDSYSRAGLKEDLEELCDLLEQDYTLGATCWWATVDRPYALNPTPGVASNRAILTANSVRIDWGDIYLTAHRLVVVDKVGA